MKLIESLTIINAKVWDSCLKGSDERQVLIRAVDDYDYKKMLEFTGRVPAFMKKDGEKLREVVFTAIGNAPLQIAKNGVIRKPSYGEIRAFDRQDYKPELVTIVCQIYPKEGIGVVVQMIWQDGIISTDD